MYNRYYGVFMEKVSVDIISLPSILDKQEELELLSEYKRTKSEIVRNKIIEGNLRTCWKFAYSYCNKYDCFNNFDDIYSECVIALVRAIEYFDESKGDNFAYFASTCMVSHFLKEDKKNSRDALYHVRSGKSIGLVDVEECEDIQDENWNEELMSQDFVDGVKRYLKRFTELEQNIIKMYWGIDYDKRYNKTQICSALKVNWTRMAYTLDKITSCVSADLSRKQPDTCKEYLEKKELSKLFKYRETMFNWYYNGRYSIKDLAEMYNSEEKYIKKLILDYKKECPQELLETVIKQKIERCFSQHKNFHPSKAIMEKIFKLYYGIGVDNSFMATEHEIMFYNNITRRDALRSIIEDCKKELIGYGVFEEDIQLLEENRERYLEICREAYFVEHHLNEDKKSLRELAKQLGLTTDYLKVCSKQYELSLKNINFYDLY
ncbi:MAG: sigma-70 family RNA polymerase sigma factor [Clostridiales bacterium]|nr:sigma-70 family RNA polymerase sigma factor [Clostridiales bacterium]